MLIDETPQPIAKFATGAVETAAYRTQWDIKDRADLLVTAAVEVFQHDDGAVIGAQLVEGRLDKSLALGPLEGAGRVGIGRLVGWFLTPADRTFTLVTKRRPHAPSATTTESKIDGDSVYPRIERAISLELVEFLERSEKRVLQDVLGILGGADEPEYCWVQSILVAQDQGAERLGLTRATCFYKAVVVKAAGHHTSSTFEVDRQFPKKERAAPPGAGLGVVAAREATCILHKHLILLPPAW